MAGDPRRADGMPGEPGGYRDEWLGPARGHFGPSGYKRYGYA
ncbi:hypothetical protein ABZ934_23940 [Streptomyces sp. NPDC046557]